MKFNAITSTLFTLTLATAVSLSLSGNAQALTFVGSSSGTWGTPAPGTNPDAVFSGVGTNKFTWGDPFGFEVGNQLIFKGNTFFTGVNALFQVGSLTYFNSTTLIGTTVDSVPLDIKLAFTSPSSLNEVFEFNFDLISTLNTDNPEESADFVFPISSFGDRSFNIGGVNYTLELTGFSQDGGATTVSEFHVLEGARTTAAIFGKITVDPRTVPEPATLGGLGLLGIYFIARRRTKKG